MAAAAQQVALTYLSKRARSCYWLRLLQVGVGAGGCGRVWAGVGGWADSAGWPPRAEPFAARIAPYRPPRPKPCPPLSPLPPDPLPPAPYPPPPAPRPTPPFRATRRCGAGAGLTWCPCRSTWRMWGAAGSAASSCTR